MKEASTLLKLSEMRGMEYFPAKNGFVFSTAEIYAAITRYKPRKLQTQAA
jgi:hypothetical protein